MKVAMFTDTYLPNVDGVVTSILSIRRGLKDEGHEVMIFAPEDERGPEEKNTVYCKAKEFKMYPGYKMASILPREKKIMKDFNPDLIHAHGIAGMCIKSLWFAKDLDVPAILTFHTMVTDAIELYSPLSLKSDFLKRLIKIYLRTAIQRYDAVIVPGSSILGEIEEIAPKMRGVEVVHTGVDTGRFRPDIDCSDILDKWNLRGKDVLLTVGRISEEKNLEVLIEALPHVKKEMPNVKLLVVGDGPAIPKYKGLVGSMGLDNDVIFTGYVDDEDLPKYYCCCGIFATASTFETQGLVILEALASGKLVVGPDYRAVPEFVIDGKTGYLFEPNGVTSCARAVLKGFKSADTIGKNAKDLAEKHSIESSTKKLIGVYERVLKASRIKGQ
ncbi:MAG: glycosyltransferase [Thermoplasmata archaeon]|nr:glycosyltransferase [Thermoplasmata archaeon]